MAINLKAPDFTELKPRILVFGVGGAGGNAVNNMVASRLEGVEFMVANTDAQALVHSKAEYRLQIGGKLTQGLGAGSRPDIGGAAAEESTGDIKQALDQSHMVFITAGMGGGTGTGAAPVIARLAREMGILTVGVVTKPFSFEGQRRMRIAEEGIEKLAEVVDTLIVIPNQNLFRVANEKTTFARAFEMADEVLYSGVRGVTDLMVMPGLINLDFADVRTVMCEMGTAMMGMGEAEGERRAIDAAEAAISNPLLDHSSMKGARGVLINITGGMDLTLYEVDEAANKIRSEVDPEANIIVGSTFDERMNGRMRVSVVATGIAAEMRIQSTPKPAETAARQSRMAASSEPKADGRRAPAATQPHPPSSTRIAASAPMPSQHPVHSMQSEILQAGLASTLHEDFTEQQAEPGSWRAHGGVESHVFEPEILDTVGPDPRDIPVRDPIRRPTAYALPPFTKQPEPKKGFSILGISIGQTERKKPIIHRPAPQLRLPPESGTAGGEAPRNLPLQPRSQKARPAEDPFTSADDELEIPAFLRRQIS